MKVLELDEVSAAIGKKPVVRNADLVIQAGELVALCGPNGAGKSSLVRVAAGLLKPTSGSVRYSGVQSSSLSARERAACLSYLAQERRVTWNMPAAELAALGAPFLAGTDALIRARNALEEVGVGRLHDRGVADMSGGERARVLLARALVSEAPLVLADEPIAGLDPDAQLLVLERLRARRDAGGAVLVSLHDLNLAAQYADRVVVLDQGAIVADASPIDALTKNVLHQVFSLDAVWVEGPDGPLLSARRNR